LLILLFSFSAFSQILLVVRAQNGDTVAKIAARYGLTATEVARFNGLLSDTALQTGREIRIPVKKGVKANSTRRNCFSETEINPDAEKLPANYRGQDLEKVINEVSRRSGLVKEESETAEEFIARVEAENKKAVTGNLNFDSLYAFEVFAVFKYNAGRRKMIVTADFTSRQLWNVSCNPVESIYKDGLTIERVNNSDDFPGLAKWQTSFDINTENARKAKPNLRLLLIATIDNEDIETRGTYYKGRYLKVNLKEIWIFDSATGNIFKKISDILDKPPLPFSAKSNDVIDNFNFRASG
jgi:LysM repeat protein